MFNLLPLLEKLDDATRINVTAGQRVGGPRLVTAMSAVAFKGRWDEFARVNAARLPQLGEQCISEMMRFVGAPSTVAIADIKQAGVPPPPLPADNDNPDKWRKDPAYIDNITRVLRPGPARLLGGPRRRIADPPEFQPPESRADSVLLPEPHRRQGVPDNPR